MKKNKKTYVLLVVVLGIWGILGMKIVSAIHPSGHPADVVVLNERFTPDTVTTKKDTFVIAANYRDPFLGTLPRAKVPPQKPKKAVKRILPPKKDVAYLGSIAQNGTQERMYFVSIDGQQHILGKHDRVQEVQLVRGSSTSITVRYGGHTTTVPLQQ
ncbi:MAG: hypothetical protein AAGB24_12860 [Bacteroidota bacterium]